MYEDKSFYDKVASSISEQLLEGTSSLWDVLSQREQMLSQREPEEGRPTGEGGAGGGAPAEGRPCGASRGSYFSGCR